jgi:Protein of unknown function (DUF4256)
MMTSTMISKLSSNQRNSLLETLDRRFEMNKQRHPNVEWMVIKARLLETTTTGDGNADEKLLSLYAMETTGGEPDVVEYNERTGEILYVDLFN